MNHRENALAILHYLPYEKLPIVAFGYWPETLEKWADEGHISHAEAAAYRKLGDNSVADNAVMQKLGFDFNWNSCIGANVGLFPEFPLEVRETFPDGSRIIRDAQGLICKEKPGTVSISAEIGTSLTGREAWETMYLPRLQAHRDRLPLAKLSALPDADARDIPLGLHVGSLMGYMRNILGVEELSYLWMDDEELYVEIINTLCGLCYDCVKDMLDTGVRFDYAHYWEDICYKNGPLVSPIVFETHVGPWYAKISELLHTHGIDIISVDCDGLIDSLLPTWLENGVNTMFPIEVGTWNASIAPWRAQYGQALRGVGGMNKNVFALDEAAVDEEVARLTRLVKLGGYLPCPDHRIPPTARFHLVQYYCQKMRNISL